MKLVLAAPASFFPLAEVSQVALASRSHLVEKLFSAAPASFFSSACDCEVAVCADALTVAGEINRARTILRMRHPPRDQTTPLSSVTTRPPARQLGHRRSD